MTSIVNFDKYKYNIKSYQMKDSEEIECFIVAYIKFCLFPTKCSLKTIINNDNFIYEKKELTESTIINNN